MASTENKIQKLHDAGIIVAQHFSESDKQIIEQITDEEIDVLVKLRQKMGEAPEGKEHLRPNIAI
ncbi:MAG TPA: aroma-sacti cluster domain-containing protein [Acidobacteriaceae bacterium]|nr:aroma-sacti cluster domain-containing protein [Acidobacteriaceae bacterium]